MSSVIFDIAGGTFKNIGTLGGSGFDLEPFPTGVSIAYNATTKSVRTCGTGTYPCLKTKNPGSSYVSQNFGLRLVFTQNGAGTIWGTYINSGAFPIRFYVDSNNIYYTSSGYVANGGLIVQDGVTVNDITFFFTMTGTGAGSVKITNNKTGVSKTIATSIGTSTINAHDTTGSIYLGCANYSGSPNYAGDLTFYAAAFANTESFLYNMKYLLKKDDMYYGMDLATDGIVEAGTDVTTAANTYGVDKLYDVYYPLLGEYKLIMVSDIQVSTLEATVDTEIQCFTKEEDGSISGINSNANILSDKGISLTTLYADNTVKDYLIRVPSNMKLILDDSLVYEPLDIGATLKDRGLAHNKGTIGIKNCKSYGHALTDRMNIADRITTELVNDAAIVIGHTKTSYKKPEYYHSEEQTLRCINIAEGIDAVIASSIDSKGDIVRAYAIDATMFSESFEIDLEGSGMGNIKIDVNNFISIKLPDGITNITYPDWLIQSGNKLSGMPTSPSRYKIVTEFGNVSTSTTIEVQGAKRIK